MIPMVQGGAIDPSTMALLTENGTISRGQLHISYRDMCTYIFDPVIDQIIASMGKILSEHTIDSVILAGGFSDSFYLISKIEECLEQNNIKKPIKMTNGHNATMDGAVYYGLNQVNNARKNL
jgi:tRNA A37 threonylcarbamoyltransferase TsaD